MLPCWLAATSSWNACSAVIWWRDINTPCAWPMTPRVSTARRRCSTSCALSLSRSSACSAAAAASLRSAAACSRVCAACSPLAAARRRSSFASARSPAAASRSCADSHLCANPASSSWVCLRILWSRPLARTSRFCAAVSRRSARASRLAANVSRRSASRSRSAASPASTSRPAPDRSAAASCSARS